jgi:nucleoside-diphosphate-sugar epimerase
MKVLITGNMGYVGPVLVRYLRKQYPSSEIIGYDQAFFGHALTGVEQLPEALIDRQYYGDVRHFPGVLLEGVDAVVHLAAVSNDPIGKQFEDATVAINQDASVRIAKLAAEAGVKNFVFASSCSMYGQAEGGPRKESDATNPLTAYAKSKIGTESNLRETDLGKMVFTSLRFSTACGMSDRLRLDLVLNDFVGCALTSHEITVLSDGSPWRPLIDVYDMARAIDWAITRLREDGGAWLAVNVGSNEANYQVHQLASAVARLIPGTSVSINKDAPPDNRSYQVDFSLFKSLAPDYYPIVDLDTSIINLKEGFERMNFGDKNFRESPYMRLNILRRLMASGAITNSLEWNRR